jgi:hypothetical protein
VVKIRIDGSGGDIVADIVSKALKEAGVKVTHHTLDHDTPKEKAAVTRAATYAKSRVAIYEMPSAQP